MFTSLNLDDSTKEQNKTSNFLLLLCVVFCLFYVYVWYMMRKSIKEIEIKHGLLVAEQKEDEKSKRFKQQKHTHTHNVKLK